MNIFELLVVQPLFNLLMLFYSVIPGADFGVSVIIFTILLRLAMHPLIEKQLHQTKIIRKIQPELEALKRRTKGNRQLQSIQMMELYKKHGINPFRSIGTVLIQLPIFIALYWVIRIFALERDQFAKYTYDFLQNFEGIKYIVDNPSLFNEKLFGFVDLTQHAFTNGRPDIALVIIAVTAAILQYIQSKQVMPKPNEKRRLRDILAEAADGKQADQSEINSAVMSKMIYMLPVFMLFVMLSLPGAIAVYYATSTLVAVIQQHFILREDEEEMEEIVNHAKTSGSSKKATAKAREKEAREAEVTQATVTRIVAKGSTKSRPSNKKSKKKRG